MLKFIQKYKVPWRAKALLNKNKVRRPVLQDIKTHCNVTIIKTMQLWCKSRQISVPEIPRNKFTHIQTNAWWSRYCRATGKGLSVINDSWVSIWKIIILDSHSTSYTKINSTWIAHINVKDKPIKLFRRKYQDIHGLKIVKDFLNRIQISNL